MGMIGGELGKYFGMIMMTMQRNEKPFYCLSHYNFRTLIREWPIRKTPGIFDVRKNLRSL